MKSKKKKMAPPVMMGTKHSGPHVALEEEEEGSEPGRLTT